MSVLNYATSVSDLSKINSEYKLSNIGSWADNDKRKIIFTGDKHIITHGVDLLADFNGNRGLVPNYPTSGDLFTQIGDYGILGKTGWIKLTTNHLPISTTITTDENLIPTNSAVYNYVADQIGAGFAANDAMMFKGSVESSDDLESKVPYSAGYTYRATKLFLLNEKPVEIGDLVIAKKDNTLYNVEDWFVVQTNINGYTEVHINGIINRLYSDNPNPIKDEQGNPVPQTFYAPTSWGSNLEVLIGNGKTNAPVWKSLSEITVGSATNATTALTAAKVANTLTIGNGLLLTDGTQASTSYDGSKALTLNLIPASYSNLGGVQIANNGYLTITNGILDFDPASLDDLLGGSIEGVKYTLNTSTINSTTSSLNLTGKLGTSSVSFLGINIGITSTSTTNDQGNVDYGIKFALNQATDSLLGGVKLMRKALTSNITPATAPEIYGNTRNYAVDLDKDGKMFVHVPWTDSNNTWREIRINNKSINNSILNIAPSSDIVMSYENEEIGGLDDGIATISFKLGILNLSSGEWEYDN